MVLLLFMVIMFKIVVCIFWVKFLVLVYFICFMNGICSVYGWEIYFKVEFVVYNFLGD